MLPTAIGAGRPVGLPQKGTISAQTTTALRMARKTAADPRSLARPERSCSSGPIRSTAASMALFNNSTTRTIKRQPTSRARSVPVRPNQRPSGAKRKNRTVSCRNADSWRNADRKPESDQPVARIMCWRPLPLSFPMGSTVWLLFQRPGNRSSLQLQLSSSAWHA